MNNEEVYKTLSELSRPIEIFGNTTKDNIKTIYRNMAKKYHPDKLSSDERTIGEKIMQLLNATYEQALKELDTGIYNLTDSKELYKHKKPCMEFNLSQGNYKFYEEISQGDTGVLYKGIHNDDIVYLKIALTEDDNNDIHNEYTLLSALNHHSIPKVLDIFKINGLTSIIFTDFKGIEVNQFIKDYGYMENEHILWILERILSAVGYLHSNNIVHGNIKPENIYIDSDTHNIILLDYSLAIEKADLSINKYRIINDNYTAPEVNINARVLPNSDIYSVGKIIIKLLGGDIHTNGMPIHIDIKIRNFIRRLITDNSKLRSNDAYKLWDEIIAIRHELYGRHRFLKLERKYKGVF
jgi:serine/threonine protein kinase